MVWMLETLSTIFSNSGQLSNVFIFLQLKKDDLVKEPILLSREDVTLEVILGK